MESAKLRRNSSQKTIEVLPLRKVKRMHHIKSLPAYDRELFKMNGF